MGTTGSAEVPTAQKLVTRFSAILIASISGLVGLVLGLSIRSDAPQIPLSRPLSSTRPIVAPRQSAAQTLISVAPTVERQRDHTATTVIDLPAQSQSAPSPSVPSVTEETEDFKILEIDAKVTETNDVWSRFSWRLTIKNFSNETHAFDATIEFQDAAGFIIERDNQYNLVVRHSQEETFTGYQLIRAAVRDRVAKIDAKVKLTH